MCLKAQNNSHSPSELGRQSFLLCPRGHLACISSPQVRGAHSLMRPPVQKGQVVCSAQSIVSRISIFSSWFFLWIHMSGQWIVGKGATKCLEIAIILRLVLSSLKFPSTVFSAHSPCSLMDDCSCSASLLKVEHPELNLRV